MITKRRKKKRARTGVAEILEGSLAIPPASQLTNLQSVCRTRDRFWLVLASAVRTYSSMQSQFEIIIELDGWGMIDIVFSFFSSPFQSRLCYLWRRRPFSSPKSLFFVSVTKEAKPGGWSFQPSSATCVLNDLNHARGRLIPSLTEMCLVVYLLLWLTSRHWCTGIKRKAAKGFSLKPLEPKQPVFLHLIILLKCRKQRSSSASRIKLFFLSLYVL